MSFLFLIVSATGLAWVASRLLNHPLDLRGAMRWGMGLGFLFTGVDHFVSAQTRYVPMMPDALADHALAWVYLTGAAELLGGLALLVPVTVFKRLGLPNLQRQAGIWLAVMLVCVVAANINVALKGQTVQGLDFGAWYFWIRPLFQPVFIAWALYCVGVWPRPAGQPLLVDPRHMRS
ncbi:DoxX family protein [Caldimonas caldifontis]|uniref:DoxX family protein n=1 Tax=Caldimonas caldifontis TaxID=1452508 RepID=UPI0011B0C78A|nr:DoxX family protein [Caldimonas caldifontis]